MNGEEYYFEAKLRVNLLHLKLQQAHRRYYVCSEYLEKQDSVSRPAKAVFQDERLSNIN
jgi:hypothetical protein